MSSTSRSGLGVLRRLRLREVVLFSLPPLALALYLFCASVLDYASMRRFDDWWSQPAHVDRFAAWRVRSALHLPRSLALDQRMSVEDPKRALLDLRVDRELFDAIADDPIAHAGQSVQAFVFEGNTSQQVELRLRGDTSVHWTAEKKTLAIKSDRGEMFQGSRWTVLSSKEVLPQFTANSMAADFGLIAVPTAVVPVYMNQRFNGLFRAFVPLDETFLRNAGRIPGNIFRGDTAERGDYFKGLPRELFVNPYIWDRVAANDRPGAIGTAKLFDFVERVNRAGGAQLPAPRQASESLVELAGRRVSEPGADPLSQLFEILDFDEIARLLALELVIGDPWHISGVHNHFWYEDSSSGLLHPIPWDLRVLEIERPPQGANFNRFWRAALRDPRLFARALEEIHARNADGALLTQVSARVEEVAARYRDEFEFDRLRSGPISDVGTPEQVLATLRKNLAHLNDWVGDARASFAVAALDESGLVLDVVVDGRSGVDWASLDCGINGALALFADADLDGVPSAGDREILLAGDAGRQEDGRRSFALASRETLLPGVRAAQRLEPEPLAYRFFLRGEAIAPSGFGLRLKNTIQGAPVIPTELSAGAALPCGSSAHPWARREPPAREVKLSGDVRLATTLAITRNTTLRIEPGTRIVLEPNVSIHCKGRIEALGSEAEPITIESADPRRPWGSLALWGEGANESRFEHVRFSGGGGALLDDVEYTGMVCVHWARAVRFEHCEFSGNQRCDDALHADVADVTLSHCWFHDTNADAVDFDISTGMIEHCKVERAGNDGFDLMTCSPTLRFNAIQGNGDKGISVGENSSPLVFSNTIRDNQRGIEVKDRSAPLLLNNSIEGNQVGVLARLKNWRYERGGWPRLVRSKLMGNATNLELQATTRLTVLESLIGPADDGAAAGSGADLRWLYAMNGIALDQSTPGAASAWRAIQPATIVDEEHFRAGWNAPEGTWSLEGGVTSARISEDCLVLRTNGAVGSVQRAVQWNLGDEQRSYWLVLEASATDIEFAEVLTGGFESGEPPRRQRFEPGVEPQKFALVALPLVEPVILVLGIEVHPKSSRGRLNLHRWLVVSALTAELGQAK